MEESKIDEIKDVRGSEPVNLKGLGISAREGHLIALELKSGLSARE